MNCVYFGTKRTFHGFLKHTRKRFAELGLTAARFDVLHVVDETRRLWRVPAVQSDLWRTLGVTPGVVSRMLRSLERLGFVKRERAVDMDARQVWVEITAYGAHVMKRARRVIVGVVRRMVFRVVCFGVGTHELNIYENMDQLEGYLKHLRERCGDTATLSYGYGHPDD